MPKLAGKHARLTGAPPCAGVPWAWRSTIWLVVLPLCVPAAVFAGPPYVTDDPEPVGYQHWEVYLASQLSHDAGSWSGTAPHVEVNYGALSNLQLHLIAPLAFARPVRGHTQYGYADTELGAKWRFIAETSWRPQVGTFPLLELPTGTRSRDLGSGHVQAFLPLWLQKRLGPWTSYGGGGYWINPGARNRNWLNKGESSHDLSRFLCFGKDGVVRGYELEDQMHTFSCLAVLYNAVVAWNTQHLAQLIEQLRREGHVVDEQDLRQISPLLRKHINPFGRYHFNLDRMKRIPAVEGSSPTDSLTEVFR